MLFGLRTWRARNHVLDRGPEVQISLWGGAFLKGEGVAHCKVYRNSALQWPVQKQLIRSRCCLGCGHGWAEVIMGPDCPVKMGPDCPLKNWTNCPFPWEGTIFEGNGRPLLKYSYSIMSWAKTAESIEMPFWMLSRVDLRNHVLDGGPDLAWVGRFWVGRASPGMPHDTLTWAVQKRLNR